MDDLENYLALPAEANLDLNVLAWWKARDHEKKADPATGRPDGRPAAPCQDGGAVPRPPRHLSAGVERMFSKAGKLHDDMKKGQEDDTLEHSFFAAANTE